MPTPRLTEILIHLVGILRRTSEERESELVFPFSQSHSRIKGAYEPERALGVVGEDKGRTVRKGIGGGGLTHAFKGALRAPACTGRPANKTSNGGKADF